MFAMIDTALFSIVTFIPHGKRADEPLACNTIFEESSIIFSFFSKREVSLEKEGILFSFIKDSESANEKCLLRGMYAEWKCRALPKVSPVKRSL